MSDLDKPYPDSPDAYDKVESPAGKLQRQMREIHRRGQQQAELYGDVEFADGADGSRAILFPGAEGAGVPPPFTGYSWIADALSDDQDGWDVSIGNNGSGNAQPADEIENFYLSVESSDNGNQLFIECDGDESYHQMYSNQGNSNENQWMLNVVSAFFQLWNGSVGNSAKMDPSESAWAGNNIDGQVLTVLVPGGGQQTFAFWGCLLPANSSCR